MSKPIQEALLAGADAIPRATAEECDEFYERHKQEGIKHFLIARLARPQADIVEELRGQLELGTRHSPLETRAAPNPEPRVPSPETTETR
jgi:hypothetical protein